METEAPKAAQRPHTKSNSNRGTRKPGPGPTEKQLDYLAVLAESVGLDIDTSNVKDKRAASELIDALKVLRQHGLGKTEAAPGGYGQEMATARRNEPRIALAPWITP